MCILGLDKGLNEFVCSLRVKRQRVVQRLEVRTLLQESLLQTDTASMEILLRTQRQKQTDFYLRVWTNRRHFLGIPYTSPLL